MPEWLSRDQETKIVKKGRTPLAIQNAQDSKQISVIQLNEAASMNLTVAAISNNRRLAAFVLSNNTDDLYVAQKDEETGEWSVAFTTKLQRKTRKVHWSEEESKAEQKEDGPNPSSLQITDTFNGEWRAEQEPEWTLH